MRNVLFALALLFIPVICLHADTSSTQFGPANGKIGLIVTVPLEKASVYTAYSIEIIGSTPSYGLDVNADIGITLTTGQTGNGQSVNTLQLQHSSPLHEIISNGIVSELTIVVLDMWSHSTSSSFNGSRFVTRRIPITFKKVEPQISASLPEHTHQVTTFNITGTCFSPLSTKVKPTTSKSPSKFQNTVYTVLDRNKSIIPRSTINTFTIELITSVTHSYVMECDEGTALFKFRFSSFASNAKLISKTKGVTVTIT